MTEQSAAEFVSLPMFPELTREPIGAVGKQIRRERASLAAR